LWNFEGCKFIVLTRGLHQIWVSATLRRQIRTYQNLATFEESIKRSFIDFLEENNRSYLTLRYEELIQRPVETIEGINNYLGVSLSVDDLQDVYTKPLYKAPRSTVSDYVKALLIYIKNYSERINVSVRQD
jgi:hypothetical protein